MQNKSFGQYLVDQGLITAEAHEKALHIQNKNRLLGELAVEMNFLRREDISLVMSFTERNPAMKFGEAAVSLGLLNSNQLRYLLDVRTRRKTRIGDILVEHGCIDQETLHRALMNFEFKGRRLEKILLVEPATTIAKIIVGVLAKHGYTVHRTKSGGDALTLAQTLKPDIVIAGGQLEDMEGYELCSRLLASNPAANMVILSSDDSDEHIQRAFDAGVNHFLKKPLTEKELINLVYQIECDVNEKRSEKILVIDDSRGARMIITRELQHAGFKVYMADNGRDGIARARQLRPDIITMDVEMPGMDGFEACRQLKNDADTKDIPVIIISSKSSAELTERGFAAGAVEYFTKPFRPGSLVAYIDMILESRKIDRSARILAVEDSQTTQHIIKYLFNKNGYAVEIARNGSEALKALSGNLPDLVLTDCYMPVMDGFSLTAEIRRRPDLKHLPVIMLTSAHEKEDMLKGLACGASDYIIKPFDESELLARVNVHLLNKRLFDQIQADRQDLAASNRRITAILRDLSLLNEMGARLQSCTGLQQTNAIIGDALSQLYPACAGMLVIQGGESGRYEPAAAWGKTRSLSCRSFTPEECRVLQTGREHVYEKEAGAETCRKMPLKNAGGCICIPLLENDRVFGMLHLEESLKKARPASGATAPADDAADPWSILRTAAEHIRLALSNLRLQENLREQSVRDPLTQLYNRRYLNEFIDREISRAGRRGSGMGIIMLDIDRFKQFNDLYGHSAGDVLLREIAGVLNASIRKMDIACRYGGEEFIVVLPEISRLNLEKKAEQIRAGVENNVRLTAAGKPCGRVTVSLGAATLPHNGKTADELIQAADKALYSAKNGGRNRSVMA